MKGGGTVVGRAWRRRDVLSMKDCNVCSFFGIALERFVSVAFCEGAVICELFSVWVSLKFLVSSTLRRKRNLLKDNERDDDDALIELSHSSFYSINTIIIIIIVILDDKC